MGDKLCRKVAAGRDMTAKATYEKGRPQAPLGFVADMALFGADHHHHLAAFQLWHGFDLARIHHICGHAVQQL
jgi:hypothetical protein